MSHGFRAGVLSPAAQDLVDTQEWQQGAAKLENFSVLRDGGVAGRPAFLRGDPPDALVGNTIRVPRYGLLAGQEWTTPYPDERVDDFAGRQAPTDTSDRTIPAGLYDTPGGIHRLERVFSVEAGENVPAHVIRVPLASGRPRAFTFHGVQLVQGHWRTGSAMTFGVRVMRPDGLRTTIITPSNDPLQRGQFAPGIVPRDVVVPLVPAEPGTLPGDPVDVSFVELYVAATNPSLPLTLAIAGLSCFSVDASTDMARASVELGGHVFGDPYRLIPWTVGGEVFVLVLGMEWMGYYLRQEGRLPFARQAGGNVWSFTERQLRELTWTPYGTSILLFHHDFPWPLEVVYPESPESPLQVRYLQLKNIPATPQDAVDQARRTTFLGQTLLSGTRPTLLRAETVGSTLRITWLSTGAPRYRVRWQAVAARPADWPASANSVFTTEAAYTIGGTDFVAGQSYYVAVTGIPQADSLAGESSPVSGTFQARFAAPAVPARPTLANSTTVDGPLIVSWPAVAFDTRSGTMNGYDVERRPEGRDWERLASTRSTSYTDTTATIGTTYEFRVRAWQGAGEARAEGGWSQVASRQSRYLPPGVPAGLAAAPIATADGRVRITWNAATRAQGYELQWAVGSAAFSDIAQASYPASRRVVDTDFAIGTAHRLRVRATRGTGPHTARSDWSAEVEVTPRYIIPGVPSGLRAMRRADVDGGVRIEWNAAANARGYELQWDVGQGFGSARQAYYASPALRVDTDFGVGPVVRLRVRAVRGDTAAAPGASAQRSAWSTPIQFIPQWRTPAAPSVVALQALQAASARADGLMAVSFNAVALAQGYEIQTREAAGAWSSTFTRPTTARYLEDTFTPGNNVTMRVRSVRGPASQRPERSGWAESAVVQCRNRPSTITPAVEVIGSATVAGSINVWIDPGARQEVGTEYAIRKTNVLTGAVTNITTRANTVVSANGPEAYRRRSAWNTTAGLYFPAVNRAAQPYLDGYVDRASPSGDMSQWRYEVAIRRPFANDGPRSAPLTYRSMPAVASLLTEPLRLGSRTGSVIILYFRHTVPAGVTAVDKILYYAPNSGMGNLGITNYGWFDTGRAASEGVTQVLPTPVSPPMERTRGTAQRGEVVAGPFGDAGPTALGDVNLSTPVFVGLPLPERYDVVFGIRCRHADGSVGPWSLQPEFIPPG